MDTKLIKQAEEILHHYFDNVTEPAGSKGYRIEHAIRVKNCLEKFARHEEVDNQSIDLDALLVAGLLHDVGDIEKIVSGSIDYSIKIDHQQAGAEIAKNELGKITKDQSLINKVVEIILNHHK